MAFHFRPADDTDRPRLLALMQAFYREEELAFDRATVGRALDELLRSPTLGEIWLLENDGTTVGYLVLIFSFILEFGGRQAFLDEFFLQPESRGHGFGQAALAFAAEHSRQRGIRVLRLEVARTNARAIRLYERAGFRAHDRDTMTRILV